jgi:hypothetical protein
MCAKPMFKVCGDESTAFVGQTQQIPENISLPCERPLAGGAFGAHRYLILYRIYRGGALREVRWEAGEGRRALRTLQKMPRGGRRALLMHQPLLGLGFGALREDQNVRRPPILAFISDKTERKPPVGAQIWEQTEARSTAPRPPKPTPRSVWYINSARRPTLSCSSKVSLRKERYFEGVETPFKALKWSFCQVCVAKQSVSQLKNRKNHEK